MHPHTYLFFEDTPGMCKQVLQVGTNPQLHHKIYCGMVDWVISFDPFSRLYYKWSRTGHTVFSACISAYTARSLHDNTEHTPLSGLAVAGCTRSSTSHCAQEPTQEQPPLEPARRHPSLGRTPEAAAPWVPVTSSIPTLTPLPAGAPVPTFHLPKDVPALAMLPPHGETDPEGPMGGDGAF